MPLKTNSTLIEIDELTKLSGFNYHFFLNYYIFFLLLLEKNCRIFYKNGKMIKKLFEFRNYLEIKNKKLLKRIFAITINKNMKKKHELSSFSVILCRKIELVKKKKKYERIKKEVFLKNTAAFRTIDIYKKIMKFEIQSISNCDILVFYPDKFINCNKEFLLLMNFNFFNSNALIYAGGISELLNKNLSKIFFNRNHQIISLVKMFYRSIGCFTISHVMF
jgi:hypothetical protein